MWYTFLQKETKRIDDIFDSLKMSERNIVSICQLKRKTGDDNIPNQTY